jgi:hypothetical protein
MNSPITGSLLFGVAVACAPGEQATADAPLTAAQLRESCIAWTEEPGSSGAAACVAYIRGFLDGAISIDERIHTPAAGVPESFIDRARRTRLAPAYTGRPQYCVDASVPLSRIIHEVLAHYETRQFSEDLEAAALVAGTLRRFHPC